MSLQSAAEAIPSQVQTLPDPVASVSYTNETFNDFTLGESPESLLTFTWTQEVPYPGKLRLAGDAARREVEMSQWRLDAVRLAVTSRVKEAYAGLYRIDRTLSILADSRKLLTSFLGTARVRYETGEGLLQNVLKAQTEISKLDVELQKLVQERVSTQAILNTLVGRDRDEPLGPALMLPEQVTAIQPLELEKEALDHSPEILAMEAAARRDEARLHLAQRQLKPDLMWGAAYTNRGDLDPMVMGMFGLRLPLYRERKQTQGIVQATFQLQAAKQNVSAARLGVMAEVRDLAARVNRAEALARLYKEGVIPQARSSLESAAASYGVGRIDFLTLLDDFTTLLNYEIDYEVQRAERVAALASLERLTARSLVAPDSSQFSTREVPHE
jgi:outer membrane protein TolC